MRRDLSLVLTYHAIREGPPPLCTAPARLARQLERLLEAGFAPTPLASLARGCEGATPGPRFAVSFDDGYRDFLDAALPVLEGLGVSSTLFVVAGEERCDLAGGAGGPLVRLDELADLAGRGVCVGSHGLGHVRLTDLDDDTLEAELRGSRRALERWSGTAVELFAYPFGAFDERVRAAAARHYAAAFTTQLAPVPARPDLHGVPRVDAYYLDSPLLAYLLDRGRPEPYLHARRWLRRVRGNEPRRPIPRRRAATRVGEVVCPP
jgi:peptidoglycan/xylan/chitin deacetylase (PgdA/CDA1 family)